MTGSQATTHTPKSASGESRFPPTLSAFRIFIFNSFTPSQTMTTKNKNKIYATRSNQADSHKKGDKGDRRGTSRGTRLFSRQFYITHYYYSTYYYYYYYTVGQGGHRSQT